LVVIGVDSSGHVKNPPIWMAASRTSKKNGQRYYGVYISDRQHGKLEQFSINWAEKVSAILIYRAVLPIFYEFDSIFVDSDFQGQTPYVEKYLKKLLRAKYPRKEALANPTIYFIPANKSIEVKHAHIKSQKMKKKTLFIYEKDPPLDWELEILK
jgi:hypothetical protein